MHIRSFLLTLGLVAVCSASCQNAKVGVKEQRPEQVETIPVATPTPSTSPQPNIKKEGLVELVKLDPSIKLDIRYATTNNFVGKVIYKEARAFLQRPAADSLVRIHQALKDQGYGLVIFDGYRPLSATKLFWEVTPPEKKKFVANPANGSRHNRGCAVDLGLFDLKTGANLDMPTDFDDFTAKAAIDYPGATELQKKNRSILRKGMESDGFKVYATEWWHYDFQNCPENRILDVQFSQIDDDADKQISAKELPKEFIRLFAKIVERTQQPESRTSDSVYVSLSGFVYELELGKLVKIGPSLPKRCGNIVDVDHTLLNSKMEALAGGGSLWRLEKDTWTQIAMDESIGYQYDPLVKRGVPKSVLKCLGIDPF